MKMASTRLPGNSPKRPSKQGTAPGIPVPGPLTRRTLSLLGGLCFFLSALEYMIPKPLPFMRLGLANLPLLLALDIMPFPSFLLLVGIKIIGQALISGALFSYVFLFSLGGTGASAVIMYALRRTLGKERISLIGVSAAGALASNGVQLVLAYYFVFGESVRYAAAPILALGLFTGTVFGIVSEYFSGKSRWYRYILNGQIFSPETEGREPNGEKAGDPVFPSPKNARERFREARENFCAKTFSPADLAVAGLCIAPALLLNPDNNTRVFQFLFFWALAWLSGKKNNPLVTILIMLGIVFFNLLVPYGEILFSVGAFKITAGALEAGIRRAATLEGLFMLSRCCVRKDLALPGVFGEITGESFRIFSRLSERKKTIKWRNWVTALDELLFETQSANPMAGKKEEPEKAGTLSNPSRFTPGRISARLFLAAVIILAWLPLFLQIVA